VAIDLEYLNNYDLTKLGEAMIRSFKMLSGMIDSKATN
jgi:hypothetical protein